MQNRLRSLQSGAEDGMSPLTPLGPTTNTTTAADIDTATAAVIAAQDSKAVTATAAVGNHHNNQPFGAPGVPPDALGPAGSSGLPAWSLAATQVSYFLR